MNSEDLGVVELLQSCKKQLAKNHIRKFSVFANASLINAKSYKIGNGIGNFYLLIPRNYEPVSFGQFGEGGGRTLTGPSVTVTKSFINANSDKISNGTGNFFTN